MIAQGSKRIVRIADGIVMVQNILRDHGEIYSVALLLICNRTQFHQVGLQCMK